MTLKVFTHARRPIPSFTNAEIKYYTKQNTPEPLLSELHTRHLTAQSLILVREFSHNCTRNAIIPTDNSTHMVHLYRSLGLRAL